MSTGNAVQVDGRTIKVTNLDKVMYPVTGTTKGDVIAYYAAVAQWFVPHAAGRPATRKRWVNGVGTADDPAHAFFNKNLEPKSTPDWVRTHTIEHRSDDNTYPLIDDAATLVWLAQLASLEIHVPQWRVDADDRRQNPDRLVLDLDPGPGAGMAECVEVALLIREVLDATGFVSVPVTSGSKGIHLYAGLDGSLTSEGASDVARELAVQLESLHPKLVVSNMKKDLRQGKVLLDWSQNNGNKTTIAPYSLRGRPHPTVAVPRTWEELRPDLPNLELDEVIERLADIGDPLAVLLGADRAPGAAGSAGSAGAKQPSAAAARDGSVGAGVSSRDDPSDAGTADSAESDRLGTYRSMRDAGLTPEPVPEEAPAAGDGNSFVIQEHHARRLHYDFRLEHDGVLVSWAVPKGPPTDPQKNHLAVQTEDHPLEYGSFEGEIPKGQYGGGKVTIWDAGTYEVEKWHDGKEVIATLTGRPDGGLGGVPRKFALIHTRMGGQEKNWLIHLMEPAGDSGTAGAEPGDSGVPSGGKDKRAPAEEAAPDDSGVPSDGEDKRAPAEEAAPDDSGATRPPVDLPVIEPMLAIAAQVSEVTDDDWHFEVKWDGFRSIASVTGGRATFRSRRGIDLTGRYRELAELAALVGEHDAVLDGEIVALDAHGRSRFELLQSHGNGQAAAHYMVFDLLHLDGRSLVRDPYVERRAALEDLLGEGGRFVHVPTTFGTDRETALRTSRELGLEGVVAKRESSIYQPGRRAHTWLKIKHRRIQDVIVVGWSPSDASNGRGIGSLLLAVNDDDALRYVGKVGSGFSQQALDEARQVLETIECDQPQLDGVPALDARGAHWVDPLLVGSVEYGDWTDAGRLRHTVWRGWCPECRAEDVVLEP